MDKVLYQEESYRLVGLCMKVHAELGCGFLEPVYQEAFEILLRRENVPYVREERLPIYFLGEMLKKEYYADFVCYGKIILEFKAVSQLTAVHEAQLLNYLKAANFRLGILCNFAQSSFTYRRLVNPHYQGNNELSEFNELEVAENQAFQPSQSSSTHPTHPIPS